MGTIVTLILVNSRYEDFTVYLVACLQIGR